MKLFYRTLFLGMFVFFANLAFSQTPNFIRIEGKPHMTVEELSKNGGFSYKYDRNANGTMEKLFVHSDTLAKFIQDSLNVDLDPTGSVMAQKLRELSLFTEDSIKEDVFSSIIRFQNDTFITIEYANHESINVDSLFWDYTYNRLGVKFSKTFSKIHTSQVTGDEKYAREGISVGVSQGFDLAYIEFYKRNIVKKIASGNDNFTYSTNRYNCIDSVRFNNLSELVVYHKEIKNLGDDFISLSCDGLVHAIVDYSKTTKTTTYIKFYNLQGDLLASDTLIPSFSFFREGLWHPSISDLSIGGSNIWFFGYMKE